MKGFTLIELLVVVLIIGILASIALPQYELAVAKSRVSNMQQICRAIKDGAEVYYLANGNYGWTFGHSTGSQFDINFPKECKPNSGGGVQCGDLRFIIMQSNDEQRCAATYQGGRVWLTYSHYFDHSPSRPGERTCGPVAGDFYPLSKRVCKAIGGVEESKYLFVLN